MIYTDNGAAIGNRTRLFRAGEFGGIEWMYAVDYAGGCNRWYGYGAMPGLTIPKLQAQGMKLAKIDGATLR